MGRTLPVAALFQHATVESLAELLRRGAGPWSPLVEIQRGDGKRPFFCVHPVGGTILSYAELARLLGPEQPLYGLQSRGLEDGQEPLGSIEAMAALYIEAVRTVQPHGPYLLGGWSMGGAIALEMAQQLQRRGQQVERVVLIDSFARPFSEEQAASGAQDATRLGALFYRDLLGAAGQASPLPETLGTEEAGRSAASALGIGLEPLQALQRVFESNLRAAWKYVPQPYVGPLVSFEASDSPQEHGWQQLAAGGVEVHRLEGDHYSILRNPGVEALATQLRKYLPRESSTQRETT
jgi:thioesterase domain-containing protein